MYMKIGDHKMVKITLKMQICEVEKNIDSNDLLNCNMCFDIDVSVVQYLGI